MHDQIAEDDEPSDDEPFARLFAVSELQPGNAKMVPVGDFDIALFNVGGEIFAIDDVCPHFAGSLAEGTVEGETVSCPLHGWCFNLRDGKMTGGRRSVATFDVRVDAGEVYVSRVPRVPAE
jgi:NAD(P)H-dependent nitrite reductase small subunit